MVYIFSCCGAGTAADTEYVTNLISAKLELHSLNTGRQVSLTEYSLGPCFQDKLLL